MNSVIFSNKGSSIKYVTHGGGGSMGKRDEALHRVGGSLGQRYVMIFLSWLV